MYPNIKLNKNMARGANTVSSVSLRVDAEQPARVYKTLRKLLDDNVKSAKALETELATMKSVLETMEKGTAEFTTMERKISGAEKSLKTMNRTIKDLGSMLASSGQYLKQLDQVLSGQMKLTDLNLTQIRGVIKDINQRLGNMGGKKMTAEMERMQLSFRKLLREAKGVESELSNGFTNLQDRARGYVTLLREGYGKSKKESQEAKNALKGKADELRDNLALREQELSAMEAKRNEAKREWDRQKRAQAQMDKKATPRPDEYSQEAIDRKRGEATTAQNTINANERERLELEARENATAERNTELINKQIELKQKLRDIEKEQFEISDEYLQGTAKRKQEADNQVAKFIEARENLRTIMQVTEGLDPNTIDQASGKTVGKLREDAKDRFIDRRNKLKQEREYTAEDRTFGRKEGTGKFLAFKYKKGRTEAMADVNNRKAALKNELTSVETELATLNPLNDAEKERLRILNEQKNNLTEQKRLAEEQAGKMEESNAAAKQWDDDQMDRQVKKEAVREAEKAYRDAQKDVRDALANLYGKDGAQTKYKKFVDEYGDISNISSADMKGMIQSLEAMTPEFEENSEALERHKQIISSLKEAYAAFQLSADKAMQDVSKVSEPRLEALHKHYKTVVDDIHATTKARKEAQQNLDKIENEQKNRKMDTLMTRINVDKDQNGKTVVTGGNDRLAGKNLEQTRQMVKAARELQANTHTTREEYVKLAEFIAKGTDNIKKMEAEERKRVLTMQLGNKTEKEILAGQYKKNGKMVEFNGTETQIRAAIALLEERNKKLQVGSKQWIENNELIHKGNQRLTEQKRLLDEKARQEEQERRHREEIAKMEASLNGKSAKDVANSGNGTEEQLRNAIKLLEEENKTIDVGSKGWKENVEAIYNANTALTAHKKALEDAHREEERLKKEEQERMQLSLKVGGRTGAEDTIKNGGTEEEMRDAIKYLEDINKLEDVGSNKWRENVTLIHEGNQKLQEQKRLLDEQFRTEEQERRKKEEFTKLEQKVGDVYSARRTLRHGGTEEEMRDAIKYLEEVNRLEKVGTLEWKQNVDAIYDGNKMLGERKKYLEEQQREQEKIDRHDREIADMRKTLGVKTEEQIINGGGTETQIKNAIALLEEENKKLTVGGDEWKANVELIYKGNNLLTERKRQLEEERRLREKADREAKELDDLKVSVGGVPGALTTLQNGGTEQQMRDAIKYIEEVRKGVKVGETAWNTYTEAIYNATQKIDEQKRALQEKTREDEKQKQLAKEKQKLEDSLGGKTAKEIVSDGGTEQQMKNAIKLLQMEADNIEVGSDDWKERIKLIYDANQKLQEYKKTLDEEAKQEELNESIRRGKAAESLYDYDKDTGRVDTAGRSIADVKKDIDDMKAYRDSLEAGSDDAKDMTDKIVALQNAIRLSSEEAKKGADGIMSFGTALDKWRNDRGKLFDENGMFKGSLEELEKFKKSLEDGRKKIDFTSAQGQKDFKDVEDALAACDRASDAMNGSVADLGAEIKKMPYDDLEKLEKALSAAMRAAKPDQIEVLAAKHRDVVDAMEDYKEKVGDTKTLWEKATGSLVQHLTTFMGFKGMMATLQDSIQGNIELSDAMTNVEKISGLTADEMERLTMSLRHLDTRVPLQQLLELAEQGAKLGIATKYGAEGLEQFVEAGQRITSTLSDIGGAESITELLKINDLVNKDAAMGLEESLDRIGSAVLKISNNSKASASGVVEFTKRIGSIGSVTGVSMKQLMALGGTFSTLGTEASNASTAMGRVLMGINTNTTKVAEAAKVSVRQLNEFVDNGDTFSALMMVLEGIKDDGAAGVEKVLKAIGGKNNTQAKAAIAALVDNLGELKQQLRLADEGYEDGTLAIMEFNKANDNLAGTIQRIKNEMQELTTNEDVTGFFNKIAHGILWLIEKAKEIPAVAAAVVWSLTSITAAAGQTAFSFAVVSKAATAFGMSLLNIVKSPVLLLFNLLKVAVYGLTSALTLGTVGVKSLKAALISLKATIASNPIGLILTALASMVALLYKGKKETSELADAIVGLREKMDNELNSLKYLNDALKKNVDNLSEKKRLTDQFNQRYGEYLSNLLSEKSTVEQIAIAYQNAANAIREKTAAEMEIEGKQRAFEGHESDIKKELSGVFDAIIERGGSEAQAQDVVNALYAMRNDSFLEGLTNKDAIYQTLKDRALQILYPSIKEDGNKYVDKKTGETVSVILPDFIENLQNIAEQYSKINMETNMSKSAAEDVRSMIWGDVDETQQKLVDVITQQLDKFENGDFDSTWSIKELYGYIKQLDELSSVKGYNPFGYAQGIQSYVNARELKERLDKQTNGKSLITQIEQKLNVWGTPSNKWEEMDKETLAQVIKYLNDVANNPRWNQSEDWNEIVLEKDLDRYGIKLPARFASMSKDDKVGFFWEQWRAARKIQKEKNHANDSGNFIDPKDGSGEKFKESEGAKAELERYYEERETIIETKLANEIITEEEANREKERLEMEHQERVAQLQRLFTNDQWGKEVWGMTQEQLDKEEAEFKAWWGGLVEQEKLAMVAWEVIDKEWKEAEHKAIAKNNNEVQKALNKVKQIVSEHNKEIRKILVDGNPFMGVMDDLRSDLDTMDLIYGYSNGGERDDVDEYERRLDILKSFLSRANSMTRDYFDEMLMMYEEFREHGGGEVTVIYEELLKKQEAYEEAARKKAKKTLKVTDNMYESGAWYEQMMRNVEANGGVNENAAAAAYLSKRQGTGENSYVKQMERTLTLLKEVEEREQGIGRMTGVDNSRKIAKAGLEVSEMELKMAMDKLTYRKSLYGQMLKNLEDEHKVMKEQLSYMKEGTEEYARLFKELGTLENQLSAIRIMHNEAVKDAEDGVLAKQKEVAAKSAELMSAQYNRTKEWTSIFNEAMSSLASAGDEAFESKQFELAIARWNQAMGYVAATTEKTKYLIVSAAGEVEEKWLDAIEAIEEEQKIAAQNAMKDVLVDVMNEFGEKLSQSIVDSFNAEQERQMLVAQKRMLEESMQSEQEASLQIQMLNEQTYTQFLLGEYKTRAQGMVDAMEEQRPNVEEFNKALMEGDSETATRIMQQWKRTSDTFVKGKEQEVDTSNKASRQMIAAANLYSAAYSVITNDAMNGTQKAAMFTVQVIGQTLMTLLSAAVSKMVADTSLNLAEATGKVFAQLGASGFFAIGGITAAIGAAVGLATNAVKKSQAQIQAATQAGGGKVKTGMLTYAEGTDPVMGADGRVYDAKRVERWKTGLVDGPHYGIVGEKGTELIVDAGRTKEIVRRPWLYSMVKNPGMLPAYMDMARVTESIGTLRKNGLFSGMMRTYASGNVDALGELVRSQGTMAGTGSETAGNGGEAMAAMQEELRMSREVNEALLNEIRKGIGVRKYGRGGLLEETRNMERFARENGL